MEKAHVAPRWRNMVTRVLYVLSSGLSQLVKLHLNQRKMKCQSIAARRADWTLKQQGCVHPQSHRRRGSNQYGRWETCQKCLVRVSYQAASAAPKAKNKKKDVEPVLVTPALQQTLVSAEPIIYQRPHSGDCCDCHLSDQGHVRELPQSDAGSDDSVRSSFAAAVPRSSSSMASTCISRHSTALDGSSVSRGCDGSRGLGSGKVSCKGSAVPWTECSDDAVRFESDRSFVVYYVPEGRPGTEIRKLFPGDRDRTKREYFTTTSSGIMIQCADPKLATHVKCYAPEVTRLLVDQDVVDETVF